MIFSSGTFFAFFAAVLALYLATITVRQRAALLLVASIVFYASWRPAYLLLLGVSLGVNYFIYNVLLKRRSLGVLVTGIVVNLLTLGAFKYLGFALGTALWLGSQIGWVSDTKGPDWLNSICRA